MPDNEKKLNKPVVPVASTATTTTPPIAPPAPTSLLDFKTIQHLSAEDLARSGGRVGSGAMSVNIVCSENNGKRVKFSKALHEALGSPTQIQVAQVGNQLLVGKELPNATQKFSFSKGKGTTIIYSALLVQLLIKKFNLDFTNKRVSRSYGQVTIESQEINGKKLVYAIILMQD
jgi:hypothetical protein